ncbi:MAG: hypothetical protein WD749_07595 [Phycisphaerales bacterium]
MNRIAAVAVLCVVCAFVGGCDPRAGDKEEIRQVFADFESYNQHGNGKAILDVFTEGSYPVYETLIKVALDGSREEVRKLGASHRLEVFRMRARGKRAELEKLNGKQYTEFATSRRWYSMPAELYVESSLERFRFKEVEATAELVNDGERTRVRIRFVREGDRWKLDEPAATLEWDKELAAEARREGVPLDEYLLEWLELELGREVDRERVWKAMGK